MNNLEKLVASAQQNPGISLEQDFYCNPEIHELELARIFARLWMMVGHVSRIPEPGQYFLYETGRESVIIIRESETTINAFHNVYRDPCHIQVFEGLIFISLSQDEPPDLETLYGSYHDFGRTAGAGQGENSEHEKLPHPGKLETGDRKLF